MCPALEHLFWDTAGMKPDAFDRLLASPWLNFLVGLVLVLSSGWETVEAFSEESNTLGAHHGVLLFSVVQVLKVLPDLMEALRSVDEGTHGFSEDPEDERAKTTEPPE